MSNFSAAYDAQRASIDQQLAEGLAGLAERRQAASALIGTLPATSADNYNEASGNLTRSMQNAQSAMPSGWGGGSDVEAQTALASLQANKAGSRATEPFLQLAGMAREDQGRTSLQGAALSAQGAIEAARIQAAQQAAAIAAQRAASSQAMAIAQMNNAAQDAAARRDHRWQVGMLSDANTLAANQAYAAAHGGMTQGQVGAWTNSPVYGAILQAVAPGGSGIDNTDPSTVRAIYDQVPSLRGLLGGWENQDIDSIMSALNTSVQGQQLLQVLVMNNPAWAAAYAKATGGTPAPTG